MTKRRIEEKVKRMKKYWTIVFTNTTTHPPHIDIHAATWQMHFPHNNLPLWLNIKIELCISFTSFAVKPWMSHRRCGGKVKEGHTTLPNVKNANKKYTDHKINCEWVAEKIWE